MCISSANQSADQSVERDYPQAEIIGSTGGASHSKLSVINQRKI